MGENHGVEVVEFNHTYLVANPERLEELARLYCSIWERDENFGEYRICQRDQRYYSWEQVELEGVTSCPVCGAPLDVAWKLERVVEEILVQAGSADFFGVVARGGGSIIGFAWSIGLSFEEVALRWGDGVCSQLKEANSGSPSIVYFDELGVAREYRRCGIGGTLVKRSCSWGFHHFPENLGLLRTHRRSPAVHLYQKVGYKILCDDTQYGGGRILLYTPKMRLLRPDKLVFAMW